MGKGVRVLALLLLWPSLASGVSAAADTPVDGMGERHKKRVSGEPQTQQVETENLFGFTDGSDTGEAGSTSLELDMTGRFTKRAGSYAGVAQKFDFGFGVTDDLSISLGVLGDYHRVRDVPDLENLGGRYVFNGVGGEVRYRILNREAAPFGVTLHVEPSIARVDEESGERGRRITSETKLILDRELVPQRLFGAVNLLYEVDRFRGRGAAETERSSNLGTSIAIAYQIGPSFFIGGEGRYLRAYEGYGLDRYQGDAFFLGPTLFLQPVSNVFISAAYQAQVVGRERRGGQQIGRSDLNLRDFERHRMLLKVGIEF